MTAKKWIETCSPEELIEGLFATMSEQPDTDGAADILLGAQKRATEEIKNGDEHPFADALLWLLGESSLAAEYSFRAEEIDWREKCKGLYQEYLAEKGKGE